MENDKIFGILQFEKLTTFHNFTFWKIEKKIILQFEKSVLYDSKNYQIFRVFKQFQKNETTNLEREISNNSSFVMFILAILEFEISVILHLVAPNFDPPTPFYKKKSWRITLSSIWGRLNPR